MICLGQGSKCRGVRRGYVEKVTACKRLQKVSPAETRRWALGGINRRGQPFPTSVCSINTFRTCYSDALSSAFSVMWLLYKYMPLVSNKVPLNEREDHHLLQNPPCTSGCKSGKLSNNNMLVITQLKNIFELGLWVIREVRACEEKKRRKREVIKFYIFP